VGIPKDYRVNQRIRIPEVRIVDEKGEQLGVMQTADALQLAEDRGLDLVEVAPTAAPPVCRLMDYGKFRYEATRKEREARRDQKAKGGISVTREVRFKTRIGEHDRLTKTNVVRRLLEEGSKVRVSVMFRGRERTHPEVGMAVLKLVAEDLKDEAMMEQAPAFEGRFLAMTLTPPANSSNKKSRSKTQEDLQEKKVAKA
jgi:translation initiation factor IF-3